MIRIYVETEEELNIVRTELVKFIVCNFVDKCADKYNDCKQCRKENADKYIKIFKREIVETPIPVVV